MLQLIKTDLTGALALFAEYRPQLFRDSLALDIQKLGRLEDRDYLFLARREKSYLFPVREVYEAESYAYLCWTAYTFPTDIPVDALYLHVSRVVHGQPFGSVTVLDYAASALDVEQFAGHPSHERTAHIKRIIRHYRTHARIGSTMDLINRLKEGEQNGR